MKSISPHTVGFSVLAFMFVAGTTVVLLPDSVFEQKTLPAPTQETHTDSTLKSSMIDPEDEEEPKQQEIPLHPYFTEDCGDIEDAHASEACRTAQLMLYRAMERASLDVLSMKSGQTRGLSRLAYSLAPIDHHVGGTLTKADTDRAMEWAYAYAEEHAYEFLRRSGMDADTIKMFTHYVQR